MLGRFVVDFYCHEQRLIIELDGTVHDQPDIAARDQERQIWLEAHGYRVLRFRNEEVQTELDQVLEAIKNTLTANALPLSRSLGEGVRRSR